MSDQTKVLLLSGSIRPGSYTRALTAEADRLLSERGAITLHWDLRTRALPLADPEFHDDPARHPAQAVRELVAVADACDAFVWASPIYHNSFSAVLKNSLDHLSIAFFRYKPVGLLGHGGGRSTQAVDQLRTVARAVHAVAIPTNVCTARVDYSTRATGPEVAAADIRRRLDLFTLELLVFSTALNAVRRVTYTGVQAVKYDRQATSAADDL